MCSYENLILEEKTMHHKSPKKMNIDDKFIWTIAYHYQDSLSIIFAQNYTYFKDSNLEKQKIYAQMFLKIYKFTDVNTISYEIKLTYYHNIIDKMKNIKSNNNDQENREGILNQIWNEEYIIGPCRRKPTSLRHMQ